MGEKYRVMSEKGKRYGLGQPRILEVLQKPALSPKGIFLGSLDEILDVAIPDYRQVPPSDQLLHAKRTEANAVKLAKKTSTEADGLFVDLWAGGLPGMETPWLLYVHPEADTGP